jgi:hypothetical protein
MSEIDAVAIQRTVRAMAAKELIDRRTIADLLFQIGIIPRLTSWENKKMDLHHPLKPSLGEVFRGDLYQLPWPESPQRTMKILFFVWRDWISSVFCYHKIKEGVITCPQRKRIPVLCQ